MNFEEFVEKEKEDNQQKIERASQIRKKEVAVISCGSRGMSMASRLRKNIRGLYEPEIFTYYALGFSISSGLGDKPRYTSSFRGYDVNKTGDNSYNVNKNYSYGTVHNYHMAVFGTIDTANVKNPERFNEIVREAEDALKQCKALMLKNIENETYVAELKQAYYKKIKELAVKVHNECGITVTSKFEDVCEEIVKTFKKEYAKNDPTKVLLLMWAFIILTIVGLIITFLN
ncbi:MAG: hypothetical protein IJX17_05130 [Clostridia bacterium]|nr:hypothetical protein [Clostridia bacterium]